jgi:hypothetical protein
MSLKIRMIFAALALVAPAASWAQGSAAGSPEDRSRPRAVREAEAQANVRQSEQYDRTVRGSEWFRQKRMRDECEPIESPELRKICFDSFGGQAGQPTR